ncbi:MAG: hypothetical protein AAB389_01135 [Patescibacteria group bacterium]
MAERPRSQFLLSFSQQELRQLYLLMIFHPRYRASIADHLLADQSHKREYSRQYRQFPAKSWLKSIGFTGSGDGMSDLNVPRFVSRTKDVLLETADWLAKEAESIGKATDEKHQEQRIRTREELDQIKKEKAEKKREAVKKFWAIINHPPGWTIKHKEAGETIVTEHVWKRFVGRCFGAQEKEQIAEQSLEFYVKALKDMFQRSKLAQWDPEAKRKMILHNLDEGRHWTDYYLDDQTKWLFAIVRSNRLDDHDKMVILTVYRYHPETHTISE